MSSIGLININSPTVALSVNDATSSRVALGTPASRGVMVTNLGSNPAWCSTGGSTVVATASTGNGCCVPAGGVETFSKGSDADTYIAAISTTGNTTLSITNI